MLKASSRSMKRFAQQRVRRGFGWETLVKPWTASADVERFKLAEGELLGKKKYINSIPNTVEPIDWSYWNSAISAPGVVAELKKSYEAHVFTDVDTTTDVKGASDVEAEIFDLEVQSNVANVELKACDEAIDSTIKMKSDMLHWSLDDWYNKIPGVKEELLEEWQDEVYIATDEEERAGQLDFGALAKDVAKGKLDTNPVPPPERIGDLTMAEIEEAKANGTWTIASFMKPKAERERLYAERKKLLDKVKADLLKA